MDKRTSIRSGIGENMEDRYLFKAKRADNGEWVIGNLITNVFFRLDQSIPYILCPDKAEYDCFEDFTEENGIFEVRPDTICQCTGLKDKNGKLIWENDIVVCRDFTEEKYVIAWKQDEACFEYQQYGCSIMNFEQLSGCEVEVVGNIFDNPELLESEE
jgi:uncharacterized phage protein (TIGR01671 family)